MHRGFITLHRKIVDWEWYSDANVFRVFTHLIITANWEPKKWKGVPVKRGQKITSIQHIAEETGLTPQSVRTAINKLKSTGELTTKSTNKYTIVTLTNYDLYQDKEKQLTNKTTSELTNEQQTNNKRTTTTKQLINKETIKTNYKEHVAINCDASAKTKKVDNLGDNFFNQDNDEFMAPSIDSDTTVGIKNANNRHGDTTVAADVDINTSTYNGKTADANTVMQWSQALGICQFSEFEKMAILDLSEKGCIAEDAFTARLNSPKYFGKIDNEHTRRLIVTQKDIREKAAKKSQERGWAF